MHLGLILPNFGEGSTREGSAEGRGGGGARLRLGLGVTTDAVQILGGYGYTKEHPSSA